MKYKILVALTFILPISSFILFSVITGKTYDAQIFTDNAISVTSYEDGFVVYSEDATYNGYLIPYEDSYALYIEDNDVVKVGRQYYTIHDGTWKNINDIPPTMEKQNDWAVSISMIIGILIVILVIGGKMDLLKSHPRASVMFSLLLGTLILWGLSSVVNDLLTVFVVSTFSWAIYLIEYAVHNGKIEKIKGEKLESKLVSELKELLK